VAIGLWRTAMKLNRIIILMFVTLSAIYIGMWIAYWVLHAINNALDNLIISPQW